MAADAADPDEEMDEDRDIGIRLGDWCAIGTNDRRMVTQMKWVESNSLVRFRCSLSPSRFFDRI